MARYQKKLEEDIRCPLEYGLAIFGGKWRSRIICVLSANEKLRYSQIRKEMYNITDAVLSATLKDLMEDGIVDRKSYDEIPPRVEYSLTQKGKSVEPILQSICQWSDIFYKEEGQNEMVQCQKCDHRGIRRKEKCLHTQKKRNLQKNRYRSYFCQWVGFQASIQSVCYKALMNSSTVLTDMG